MPKPHYMIKLLLEQLIKKECSKLEYSNLKTGNSQIKRKKVDKQ